MAKVYFKLPYGEVEVEPTPLPRRNDIVTLVNNEIPTIYNVNAVERIYEKGNFGYSVVKILIHLSNPIPHPIK